MPANLINTKSAANANCYADQDEADDYLDNIYGAEEWAQLDSDTKDRLLLTAAKQIDSFNFKFGKLAEDQAMRFPVGNYVFFILDDGYESAKEANILQAFYLFQNSDAISESKTGALQGKTGESIGPMSMNTVGFNQLRAFSSEALRLITPYINLTVKLKRG